MPLMGAAEYVSIRREPSENSSDVIIRILNLCDVVKHWPKISFGEKTCIYNIFFQDASPSL